MGKQPDKKPPAPTGAVPLGNMHRRATSAHETTAMMTADIKARIANELYRALERIHADDELTLIVKHWRDKANDVRFLRSLQAYNTAPWLGRER